MKNVKKEKTILEILVWSVFLLFEFAAFTACYVFIYKKKSISNKSLLHFFKSLTGYYLFMLKYRLHICKKDRGMDDFLQENRSFRNAMGEDVFWGTVCMLILPCVVVLLAKCSNFPGKWVMFLLSGACIFLDMLKRSRIEIMTLLSEGQKFLYKFERKKRCQTGNRESTETMEPKEKTKRGKIGIAEIAIVVLIVACGEIVLILELKYMPGIGGSIYFSPLVISLFTVSCVLFIALQFVDRQTREKVRQKIRYYRHIRNRNYIGVKVSEELCDFMDDFGDMCSHLNIKEVNIGVGDHHAKTVLSIVNGMQTPEIIIGGQVFYKVKEIEPDRYTEIIKLLTAHELVHISYKDMDGIKKVYWIMFLSYCLMIFLVGVGIRHNVAGVLIMAVGFLVLDYIVLGIVRDERYWNQVKEFRADAVGMELSKTSAETLEHALQCISEEEEDDLAKGVEKNIWYRLYRRQVEQPIHPSVERRIYEAKRNPGWGKGKYFRYLWLIGINVYKGNGWRI